MSGHSAQLDHSQCDWEITDPGDALWISNDRSGVCNMISAAAETRNMGPPKYVGQQVLLYLDTDGGTVTVSFFTAQGGSTAMAINKTANNTAAFDDAGDCLLLIGAQRAGVKYWVSFAGLPEADSATLSTV